MAWYDNAVFYHIYPLGLCGCKHENTGEAEEHFDILNEWAAHAQKLNFTAIYIGPLFESGSHGYDTTDYRLVDKRLGTNDEFRKFVENCHKMGMKVIVDGVFNHTGRDFFAFSDIKKNRERSPYCSWYCNVNFSGNNEYNDGFSYENWGGYNLLAKLNLKNPEVKNYHFDTVRFWVKEFDIDGIRLDAADVLDFDFMRELRSVCDTLKPEFWLMGEVIHGDYSRWANQNMLHSVTNYELHKGLFSGHNDHNYFEIAHTINRLQGLVGNTKLYTFLDNHDVARIHSKLNQKDHIYPVTILDYLVPGIPSVYYGSEFGIDGDKERSSDWNLRPALKLSDFDETERLPKLCQKLGWIKKNFPEASEGDYRQLLLTNRQFAFARTLNGKAIVAILNNDDAPSHIELPLPVDADRAVNLLSVEEESKEEKAKQDAKKQADQKALLKQTKDLLKEKAVKLIDAAGDLEGKTKELKRSIASLCDDKSIKEQLSEPLMAISAQLENLNRLYDTFLPEERSAKQNGANLASCENLAIRDGKIVVDVAANDGIVLYLSK